MGLFNSAFDMSGGKQPPIPQLLDSDSRLLQAALALLADNGQAGGLPGLTERFRAAGLQHVMDSWMDSDSPLPMSAEQLEEVLDTGYLRQMAEETGLTEHEVAEQLSGMLPDMVHRLAMDGQVRASGAGELSALLEWFMSGGNGLREA
ncbi:YidB family protein [Noviherbaspirillum massiliense]|uniref:YidB family protein n=1 Tax=Noviherbaspirillum massiliense TaxID=1465823 RepID=UPI00030FB393|nr:YidB family protein [Noviherbaspirillum massiliense]